MSPHHSLSAWIAACLADGVQAPACALPVELATDEGILPWLAFRLQESGALTALPREQEDVLRDTLRRWGLMHLDCEAELERLSVAAAESGIRFLAFKGHSVARTLYPHPACRPTSDFDLLVDAAQVGAAQAWLAGLGYSPLQRFVGTVWLGAQSWTSNSAGNARFHVDLHWDYSNRMYFRQRVGFEELWALARQVPCGDGVLRVPCPVDNLILACIHLAAFGPGVPVRLIWLLDICLLMAALTKAEIPLLLERAAKARAIEACLHFGGQAAELGCAGNDPNAAAMSKLAPVLDALRRVASDRRVRGYQRTVRWRAWDLACYWARLPVGAKLHFFGNMARWVGTR